MGCDKSGDAKILQVAGVYMFFGVRGGKKDAKIGRCVLEVPFGRFLADFGCFFGARQARKYENLQGFCAFGMNKKIFLQQAENCLNTSVFPRLGPENTVNAMILNNTVNTMVFCFRGARNIGSCDVFAPEV